MKYNLSEFTADLHFSSAVYKINRADLLADIKPVFNEYARNAYENTPRDEVYPIIMTNDMKEDERVNSLIQYVADISWDILNDQGYFMDPFFTQVTACWGQNNPKYSSMDYHTHGDSTLCGFYFLDVPEDSSVMSIHDPRPSKVVTFLPQKMTSTATLASNIINYNFKPGDLVITNNWLPHSFSRNRSNEHFNFIHININITNNPDYKPHLREAPIVV